MPTDVKPMEDIDALRAEKYAADAAWEEITKASKAAYKRHVEANKAYDAAIERREHERTNPALFA